MEYKTEDLAKNNSVPVEKHKKIHPHEKKAKFRHKPIGRPSPQKCAEVENVS